MTDAGSDSSVTVTMQTDTDVAFGSPATLGTLCAIPALSQAGAKFFAQMPVGSSATPYERYIRLLYTPVGGNLSTGSFTAAMLQDVDLATIHVTGQGANLAG